MSYSEGSIFTGNCSQGAIHRELLFTWSYSQGTVCRELYSRGAIFTGSYIHREQFTAAQSLLVENTNPSNNVEFVDAVTADFNRLTGAFLCQYQRSEFAMMLLVLFSDRLETQMLQQMCDVMSKNVRLLTHQCPIYIQVCLM